MLKVLVCGGRDYRDTRHVNRTLDALDRERGPLIIIEGGATGADQLAQRWAETRKRAVITVEADWTAHGRAAGPIRNQEMLDSYHPSLVVAFRGGAGTADMVRRAAAAGVPVQRA